MKRFLDLTDGYYKKWSWTVDFNSIKVSPTGLKDLLQILTNIK